MSRRDRHLSPAEKKRKFIRHLRVYLAMSIFFVVLNVTSGSGHFWAIYPILGWGLGILMEGMAAYGPLRDREDEYESDDFFDLNQKRPERPDIRPEPRTNRGFREEDLV